MNTIKITIVEHHPLMRGFLARWINSLNRRFEVDQEFSTGKELVNHLRTNPGNPRPDIVLTAYQMPGMDGFELASWLKKKLPDIKIIVLSNQRDDVVVVRLIKAGIVGYLVKSADPEEILAALETVADGGTYIKDHDWNTITTLPDIEPAVRVWYDLSDIEKRFVRLCLTDLRDAEIESEIKKELQRNRLVLGQPITIAKVCEKFGVRSRIELALLFAKHRLIDFNDL